MRNINITHLIIAAALVGVAVFVVSQPVLAANCGGAETSVIDCGGKTGQEAIVEVIKTVIGILSVGVGILAVGTTILGGILYSMSGDNPEQLKRAKTIWMNTVIGLILFTFLVAITNFLVPGGVFG
ncbi:MAG: hypothetical protein Q4F02_00735 [Candidatus Saccharibacteria bacterium]|nr:hypothetical protein [Candidatus Saccharibacteria bacterium]